MTTILTDRDPITVYSPPPTRTRPDWLNDAWDGVLYTQRKYDKTIETEYASGDPNYDAMSQALDELNAAFAYYEDCWVSWQKGETPASLRDGPTWN